MAAAQGKVIITCAVTGAIHTPTMSPHLPITPEEIAEAAIGAAKAGAAIVHLHAREPKDGRPTQDPKMFLRFLPQIKAASNVVLNLTTGGAPTMSIEERLQPALQLKPEVASLNMGSMNFGLYEMIGRYKEWKHEWEKPYLAGSDERIFKNTFRVIATILERCSGNDTRFEIECYDIGHLYTAAHFLDRKLVKPPLFIQSVFGIRGGIGPHPEDVLHMKRTADRLFGDQYLWSVLGAGRNQMFVAAQSAVMGGNVRVGLEDSLWDGRGQLAEKNATQVRRARQIIEGLGLGLTTAQEAREILQQLRQVREQRYFEAYGLALLYLGLDDREEALRWLEQSYQDRDGFNIGPIRVDPFLDSLHGDPRFEALAEKIMPARDFAQPLSAAK